jgi:hypothetical protein
VGLLLARLLRQLGLLDLVLDLGELITVFLVAELFFWVAFTCSLRKYSRWALSIRRLTRTASSNERLSKVSYAFRNPLA